MSRIITWKEVTEDQDYFEYLSGLVNMSWIHKSYTLLFRSLHKVAFIYKVPNDDNRQEDAVLLRNAFFENAVINCKTATVFEVMVSLAQRCEVLMEDTSVKNRVDQWFWVMVNNLGLLEFDDESFSEAQAGIRVEEKIQDMLHRRYDPSGHGGLFPLKNSIKDQRDVELWYQMSAYMEENYYFAD